MEMCRVPAQAIGIVPGTPCSSRHDPSHNDGGDVGGRGTREAPGMVCRYVRFSHDRRFMQGWDNPLRSTFWEAIAQDVVGVREVWYVWFLLIKGLLLAAPARMLAFAAFGSWR